VNSSPTRPEKPLILNVDDDEPGRYARRRTLERAGFDVVDAGFGQEAIDKIEALKPVLVVLDVHLPDMNGLDVCKRIKALAVNVMVLQTSATFITAADRSRGLEGGADAYLIEPIDPTELVATVRALLRLHTAENELRVLNQHLEARVQERTAELSDANAQLMREIHAHQQAEEQKEKLLHALSERIKELTLLHQMARFLQNEEKPMEMLLQEITAILPRAWKHEEVAAARIMFDGEEYMTPNFTPTPWKLRADFTTPEGKHGGLEIVYLEERPDEVEGPFLAEERSLINSLAEMLLSYLERKEAETSVAQVTRELVERNEELWRLQKEKGQVEPLAALGRVTGMIAHELGTPLNTILGHSQFLGEEELTEGGRRRLKTIQKQIHRMVNTVQYYLSRTRISQPARSQVNVNELVLETLELLKPVFEQHELEVNTTLAESLAPLTANRESLQRVLINLLNNAVDALKDGGTVTITTRAAAGSPETSKEGVVIEVTDTGAGIPPEMLPEVFDLFLTTKESGKGTGLGLAVCQEIVKIHGGTIQITSKLGEGTRVRVFLPTDDMVGQPASVEVRE